MHAPRLHVRGVKKAFGPTQALAGVELSAAAGEVHAVIGENGAGKSTLMQILAGAERPDEGLIELDGEAYMPANPLAARASGVAIVHQEPALCPALSVVENVLLGIEPTRLGLVDRAAALERVHTALEPIAGGAGRLLFDPQVLVRELSPAEQQLVAIARALAQARCRLLILDEPTSRLSAEDVKRLFRVLRRLCEKGVLVLYISHFLEELERVADAYTVLRDGSSVASGRMRGVTTAELVRHMVGVSIERGPARAQRVAGEVVLSLDQLAGRHLPIAASLELRRGEVLGLAGLVGSGRTELLRAVFGLEPVVRGTIRVFAHVGPASPARRLAEGVGLSSEDRKSEGLALTLSVADNLTLSRSQGLGPPGMILPNRQRAAAERWITRLAIRCRGPAQPVKELSGGNQQKVALARLLYHDADVLLLDEPTRGVDVRSRAEIHRAIGELADRNKAIVVVSSQLDELLVLCDRVAVMRRGRLGPARPVSELDEHALLSEAVGG